MTKILKNILIFLFAVVLFSCQQEEQNVISVDSVSFNKDSVSIMVEQSAAVPFNVSPVNADFNLSKLSLDVIPSDLCTVSNVDKSGCIITGLKKGSGVLTLH